MEPQGYGIPVTSLEGILCYVEVDVMGVAGREQTQKESSKAI